MNLSVIIATYGSDEWVDLAWSRAYQSVLAQDPGGALLTTTVVHEPDGTIASARNAGAAQAAGEWLCFLDADDELAPGFVAAMERVWLQGTYDWQAMRWLLTPAVAFTRSRKATYRGRIWPAMNLRDGNYLCIGTLVPAELFREVGGFREWPLFEDWDLWQRCAKAGARVVEVRDALYVAYMIRGSRNRVPRLPERDYWHQRIGHDNWPDYYDATTSDEDARRRLIPAGVRKRQAA